jgi:hypothetical protein
MTGMTHQTGKTARQRRKQAKKREQGRNPWFQDEYLMASLQAEIKALNSLAPKVETLLHTLVKVSEVDVGGDAQRG